jgi:hypothetical protein
MAQNLHDITGRINGAWYESTTNIITLQLQVGVPRNIEDSIRRIGWAISLRMCLDIEDNTKLFLLHNESTNR